VHSGPLSCCLFHRRSFYSINGRHEEPQIDINTRTRQAAMGVELPQTISVFIEKPYCPVTTTIRMATSNQIVSCRGMTRLMTGLQLLMNLISPWVVALARHYPIREPSAAAMALFSEPIPHVDVPVEADVHSSRGLDLLLRVCMRRVWAVHGRIHTQP
jgi:hypothetical protein